MISASNYASTSPSVSAYQEALSNTAHQREVADLKAAGLNPVLSANNSGASVPSGEASDFMVGKLTDLLGAQISSSSKALNSAVKTLGKATEMTGSFWKDLAGAFGATSGKTNLLGLNLPNSVWSLLVQYGSQAVGKVLENMGVFGSGNPSPSASQPIDFSETRFERALRGSLSETERERFDRILADNKEYLRFGGDLYNVPYFSINSGDDRIYEPFRLAGIGYRHP